MGERPSRFMAHMRLAVRPIPQGWVHGSSSKAMDMASCWTALNGHVAKPLRTPKGSTVFILDSFTLDTSHRHRQIPYRFHPKMAIFHRKIIVQTCPNAQTLTFFHPVSFRGSWPIRRALPGKLTGRENLKGLEGIGEGSCKFSSKFSLPELSQPWVASPRIKDHSW